MAYSRILVDSEVKDMCFLGDPTLGNGEVLDPRRFTSCKPFGDLKAPLRISVPKRGRMMRFAFGPFDMPVVTPDVRDRLAAAAPQDLELLPAVSDDGVELAIANVLPCIDCIDEQRTVGSKWKVEDGRPDKVGLYRTIVHLFLDPSRIDSDLFRVQGWRIALIASERLVQAAGLDDIEGLRLKPVV